MGIFGKKNTQPVAAPIPETRPSLAERKIKFQAGELWGEIWSSAGTDNRNQQNPRHQQAIRAILKRRGLDEYQGYKGEAHLVPDPATGRIRVEMDGAVIDQLDPKSQALVADRVTEIVPVKCRIQVIPVRNAVVCCVTYYHTR